MLVRSKEYRQLLGWGGEAEASDEETPSYNNALTTDSSTVIISDNGSDFTNRIGQLEYRNKEQFESFPDHPMFSMLHTIHGNIENVGGPGDY